MSFLISLAKVIVAAIIAVAINFGLYTYTVTERDYAIRKDLAESGINIAGFPTIVISVIVMAPLLHTNKSETFISSSILYIYGKTFVFSKLFILIKFQTCPQIANNTEKSCVPSLTFTICLHFML